MTLHLKWIWELTPNQVFQKNRFIKTSRATDRLPQQRIAFTSEKLVLSEPGMGYQLALTSEGKTEESVALRKAHPTFPSSGDHRSGVLLFKDDTIVASLILSGVNQRSLFKMVVNPEYRREGLAEALLVLWWSSVEHTFRTEGRQPLTSASVKVLLNAYDTVVKKAVADGLPVPANVREQLVTKTEAADVLRRAQAADDAVPRRPRPADEVVSRRARAAEQVLVRRPKRVDQT